MICYQKNFFDNREKKMINYIENVSAEEIIKQLINAGITSNKKGEINE